LTGGCQSSSSDAMAPRRRPAPTLVTGPRSRTCRGEGGRGGGGGVRNGRGCQQARPRIKSGGRHARPAHVDGAAAGAGGHPLLLRTDPPFTWTFAPPSLRSQI
jgi:hypothetical protein